MEENSKERRLKKMKKCTKKKEIRNYIENERNIKINNVRRDEKKKKRNKKTDIYNPPPKKKRNMIEKGIKTEKKH